MAESYKIKSKKTRTKRAGLKSSFVNENKGLMTAFGKGNNAVIEKRISGNLIENVSNKPRFSVEFGNKEYIINDKKLGIVSDDPRESQKPVGEDGIHCKRALEERYFGKTFNDNIHIQLIYSILDLEKILAVHSNNIVYTFDNLRRKETDEYDDFIGYMSTVNSYEEFMNPEKLLPGKDQSVYDNINRSRETFLEYRKNPRLGYFGKVFYEKVTDPKNKSKKKMRLISEKEMYYIFALLGGLRQFCTHDKNRARNWLYSLDTMLNDDAKAVLDKYYVSTVSSLNKHFVDNSAKKDFSIIFNALNITDIELKKNIAKEYYEFVCRKNFKNIGFSIKKLREYLLEKPEFCNLKEDKYNSVRSKLYRLIDFIIYLNYKDAKFENDNDEKIERFVSKLRKCPDEASKETVYQTESDIIKKSIYGSINSIKRGMMSVKSKYGKLELDKQTINQLKRAVDDISINTKGDYFTKLMYLISLLIDGKEINDLLTTLIHQFENIASFIDVMKKENINYEFAEKYKFFNTSKNIACELRTVNSFARMTGFMENDESTKFIMFREAADILGTSYTDDELTDHLNLKKTRLNARSKADTGLRNFIISNVIKSSRFKYLIRYSNPKKVKAIAENKKLVRFVLDKIPDPQIIRYCNTCGFKVGERQENINTLAKAITNFSFSAFEKVKQSANVENDTPDAIDKAQKQGLISLYLTVLYLFIKNMVYVNSRYVLAFHCLERDSQLLKITSGYNNSSYNNLTNYFIDNKYLNPHASRYLKVNISNADEWSIVKFRNGTAHLNSVRNIDTCIEGLKDFKSYFEIYAYTVQKSIKKYFDAEFSEDRNIEDGKISLCNGVYIHERQKNGKPKITVKINPKTIEYMESVDKYGSYTKDFVKALNTPFGYCLARYKNLSIEPLFDRNTVYNKEDVTEEFSVNSKEQ